MTRQSRQARREHRPHRPGLLVRAALRSFPQRGSQARRDEMLEALSASAVVNGGDRHEVPALVWASAIAWRRELSTVRGLRQCLWVGAALWLGLVVAAGPAMRLRSNIAGFPPAGFEPNVALLSVALGSMTTAVILTAWRSRASLVGVAIAASLGITTTAVWNRIGDYQLARSLAYETRWLGLALLVAVLVRPRAAWRWPTLLGLAPSGLALVMPLNDYQFEAAHNYRWVLYALRFGDGWLGNSNLVDGLFVVFLLMMVVGPFFYPSIAALFAIPVGAYALVIVPGETAQTSPAIGGYFVALFLWTWLRPRLSISRGDSGAIRLEVAVDRRRRARN